MTSLLRLLDPNEPGSVARAAEAVAALLERLPSPRSIAELHLGPEDVEWLRAWAGGMPAAAARWSGDRRLLGDLQATRQQAFGLVFLVLAAETARRDAAEGHVWGPVRRRVSGAAASMLFSQGQPKQALKDALESACRRWQLRHVFGQEGLQAWYASVYLQFGFTERTIESRLPARLANAEALPTAVHHLLYDRRLRSDSFASLWNTLIGVRRRNVSDLRARQVLAGSPWILPEWTDALLEAAVARMELTPSGLSDEEVAPSLFTVPRLEWVGQQPRFIAELVNLADVAGELQPGAYRLRAGAVSVEFTIDDLGTPHGLRPVNLPLWPAQLTATVEQHHGEDSWEPVAGEEVVLWEPSDEVAAFREDGFPLDAWSTALHPNQPYTLVLAPGLDIKPAQDRWAHADGCLVVHLPAGWPEDTGVYLEGERIWDPVVATGGQKALAGVSIPLAGTRLSDAPRIQLFGLSGRVTEVTADRRAVAFEQHGGSVEASLPSGEHAARPSVLVRTRDASGEVRSGRIPLTWSGAQHLRSNGWAPFPVGVIDERDLGQRIRAFAPEWREPTLLVGNRPIGRIGSRGRARGSVGAWGAPLLIADGQFNREPDRQLPLADAVTSRGVILDMNDDDFGGAALVTLRQPVDLGEVRVFGIDRSGAVDDIRPTPTGERSWVIEVPPENALAIVYGEEWIGAWWRRPPVPPQSAEGAVHLIGLLRDARAPLLSPDYGGWARGALRAHPASALVWLFNLSEAETFSAAPPEPDDFAPVVRDLLDGWEPDRTCVAHLARTLRDSSDEFIEGLADTALRAPAPTARLLSSVFADSGLRRRVRGALLEALGWGDASSAGVLNEIGWQFDVDSRFLERLGRLANDGSRGQPILRVQRQNLLVAMNLSGDFRRWLAGRLISED